MEKLLAVGAGGSLGAIARYLLTQWIDHVLTIRLGAFPFGTLLVNTLGSLGLAVLGVWLVGRMGIAPQMRLLLGVGFFGAFTTFSAFANDSLRLWESAGMGMLLLNVALNNLVCLLAAGLGLWLGERLFGAG